MSPSRDGSSSNDRNSFRTNLAAAIASPASGGSTSTYDCTSATNTYISNATNDGSSHVDLTLSSNYPGLAGQTAVNATFSDTSADTSITDFSGGVNGTSGCTSSTVGTIATAPTSATQASNMISAITSCLASYPAAGVTATANGSAAVNIISVTPGASDQGFSLAVTGTSATNFGFGTPANGTDARQQHVLGHDRHLHQQHHHHNRSPEPEGGDGGVHVARLHS